MPTALHSCTPSLLHLFTPSEPFGKSIPTALHSFILLHSFTLSLLQNHVNKQIPTAAFNGKQARYFQCLEAVTFNGKQARDFQCLEAVTSNGNPYTLYILCILYILYIYTNPKYSIHTLYTLYIYTRYILYTHNIYSIYTLHIPTALHSFTLLHSFAPLRLHSFTLSLLQNHVKNRFLLPSTPSRLHSFIRPLLQNHVKNRFLQPFTPSLSFTPSLFRSFRTM